MLKLFAKERFNVETVFHRNNNDESNSTKKNSDESNKETYRYGRNNDLIRF
jgi:hypothetical protein